MKAIDLGLIQARRAKLDEEIEQQRGILTHLMAKREELNIAERVFAELSLEADGLDEPTDQLGFERLLADVRERASERRTKPPGLPTMPEMIVEALRHAHSLGAVGLDPAGIVSFIRGRYWPTVASESVGPIAWRMWKRDKKLEKQGSLYVLPEADRVSKEAAVPSSMSQGSVPSMNAADSGTHNSGGSGSSTCSPRISGTQLISTGPQWTGASSTISTASRDSGTSAVALTHYLMPAKPIRQN